MSTSTAPTILFPQPKPVFLPGEELKKTAKIIEDALDKYGDDVAVMWSTGKDSTVLLHEALKIKPDIKVYFISDHPHRETWEYYHRHVKEHRINAKVIRQDAVSIAGDTFLTYPEICPQRIWERTKYDFPDVDPRLIYWSVIKTFPMMERIEEKAIMTGCRWDEDLFRGFLKYEERFEDALALEPKSQIRIHPCLHLSEFDSHDYARENEIESNPLYQMGYRSIGDRYTTTRDPSSERAGRAQSLATVVYMASIGYLQSMS